MNRISQIQESHLGNQNTYMQGAVWMGNRLLNEIEAMCDSMIFLNEEYTNRMSNPQLLTPSLAKWLISAVNKKTRDLKGKTTAIMECTLFNTEDYQETKEHKRSHS